jgi:DNA-binding CsgD family transcriptional regulator
LESNWETGNRWYLAEAFEAVAAAAARLGAAERAAKLWGAAAALRDVLGAPAPPPDEARIEAEAAAARDQLGAAVFSAALEHGRAMSLEDAVAQAMAGNATAPNGMMSVGEMTDLDVPPEIAEAGLTARELEVLRLIAEGRTNAQIGETLFISSRTASVHVGNILHKLRVSNRAAAAGYALRHGLG